MATKTTQEVETVNGVPVWDGQEFMAFSDGEFAEIMDENTGGEGMRVTDLVRINFPREATVWQVPDAMDPDNGKAEPELTGVVVQQRVLRSFYEAEFDGGNAPPDCLSIDGELGAPNGQEPYITLENGRVIQYGGDCSMCPLNQWGSDLRGGNGKACREYRMIALLEPGSPLPVIVRIPPTQLGLWHRFGVDMARMRLRLSRSVIGLGLKMGRDRKPALSPYVKAVLPDEVADAISGVKDSMKLLTERAAEPAALAAPGYGDEPFEDDDSPF